MKKISSRKDRGIALIIVLGGLAVVTVMVGHMTTTSQATALQAKVLTRRSKLKYAAESGSAHSYWMWLAHRKRFPSRHQSLDSGRSELATAAVFEDWYADGAAHKFEHNGLDVKVRLLDANRGSNLFRGHAEAFIRERTSDKTSEEMLRKNKLFLHGLQDYRDGNDLPRLKGKENAGYREDGYYLMPRNGDLQFRMELYWIPHMGEVVGWEGKQGRYNVERLRLLPPEGRGDGFLESNQKPSFFSSSPTKIKRELSLNQNEIASVIEGKKQFLEENIPLRAALPQALYSRIRQHFSVDESGVVTIEATAQMGTRMNVSRKMVITRESDPGNLHYSKGDLISNWQKMVY